MRDFVERFTIGRGLKGMIGKESGKKRSGFVEEEAPVLRPRTGMRYSYST